jgi:intein-encoded DNA endonuclease-like protein
MAFWTWYQKQTLKSLKQYIEHNKETTTYFLRGLYDSEGSNYRCRRISLSNNSEKLLCYVQYLLEKCFNIKATGPYLVIEAGSTSIKKNGEKIKSNYNIYYIAISRKESVQRFLDEVGFSIREKQLGLPRRK